MHSCCCWFSTDSTSSESSTGAAVDFCEKNQAIFRHGGELKSSIVSSHLQRYDLKQRAWSTLSAAGSPSLVDHSMVSVDGNSLLLHGGVDERGNVSSKTYEYKIEDNEWCCLDAAGDPPAMRGHKIFAADSETIVAVGTVDNGVKRKRGSTNANLFSAHALQRNPLKWIPIPTNPLPLNEKRYGFGAALADGALFIAGGKTRRNALNDVWRLDLESGEWTDMTPSNQLSPAPLGVTSLVWQGERLNIFGKDRCASVTKAGVADLLSYIASPPASFARVFTTNASSTIASRRALEGQLKKAQCQLPLDIVGLCGVTVNGAVVIGAGSFQKPIVGEETSEEKEVSTSETGRSPSSRTDSPTSNSDSASTDDTSSSSGSSDDDSLFDA